MALTLVPKSRLPTEVDYLQIELQAYVLDLSTYSKRKTRQLPSLAPKRSEPWMVGRGSNTVSQKVALSGEESQTRIQACNNRLCSNDCMSRRPLAITMT